MRIALVAPFGLRAKGTARARALPLAQALVRRGHQVALLVPPYDSPADSGLCWRAGGVVVMNVPLPGAAGDGEFGNGLAYLALSERLLAAAAAWQPEIVHVFKPKGPSGLVGAAFWACRAGRRAFWPNAALAHDLRLVVDSDDWEGPGGWNDDPRTGYSTWQRRFFAWQERFGLAHAHAWTVTSACLRDRAVGFGAQPDRVFVLPNGLANPQAAAEQPGQSGGGKRVLLYTRFAGVQVEEVAGLWRQVLAREPQAVLTVVGRGLDGEEQRLASRVPGVHVVGWLEPADMPRLFAQHALAIVPWANTPPNRARSSAKVLELMAAGLPVVAYEVGELPATLAAGGVLVPPGDSAAFAAAILTLLADPRRAGQLGAAARARIQSRYTWDHLAEVAQAAYGAALAA